MKAILLCCTFSFAALGQIPPPPQAPPPPPPAVIEPAPVVAVAEPKTPDQLRREAVLKLMGDRRAMIQGALDGVVLVDAKGDHKITYTPGNFSHTYAVVTVLFYADFPDQHAELRVAGSAPSLWIRIDNPKGRVFLVKAKVNGGAQNRSVKMGRSGYGSVSSVMVPDSDWTIPFTSKERGDGLWELTMKEPLKPGEYGIFASGMSSGAPVGAGGVLYDFGID